MFSDVNSFVHNIKLKWLEQRTASLHCNYILMFEQFLHDLGGRPKKDKPFNTSNIKTNLTFYKLDGNLAFHTIVIEFFCFVIRFFK